MRLVLLLLALCAWAAAVPALIARQQELSPVTDEQAARYISSAVVSGAVSCGSRAVTAFDCGPACDKLSDAGAEILYSDGDGERDPWIYLMHVHSENALVVAHSPTNFSSFLSVLIDANFFLTAIDAVLLDDMGVNSSAGISVHSGFLRSVNKTYEELKKRLIAAMDRLGDKISVVRFEGHSMGAASAAIEAVALSSIVKDRGYDLRLTTFGSPRVGNEQFAGLLEKTIPLDKRARVTNQNDKVPHLPGWPYKHYAGEVYIPKQDENDIPTPAAHCIGREDDRCTDKFNIFQRSKEAHVGPYFDQTLSRSVCTNADAYPPE
ncbi:Lipase [Wallemia ichthyophaga EXF-994]|uniref:Fungal lipase-type domain-containing protein n=2 Tax=Wallemia ichthyophaga TaxID=245174 RepID=A0A4T0JHJ6_WALIC|nr:Lipase [Wallemia ichthyophaga EXF-994]EOR00334.1 Lipase [Wallemia ichthyophaga EXF-994]TIB36060.1 hypothetical protein E3P84_01097 [Wallemia ichthyophaga]TIB41552.1 hypothetical protein E3P83_01853 [Wallemia ichthyophaga]TIB42939.1 hypothetical protein E3P86_00153 [Wallemia ichthyophaga]